MSWFVHVATHTKRSDRFGYRMRWYSNAYKSHNLILYYKYTYTYILKGGGANGSRALFDEQAAAGDPASNGAGNTPVIYPYMAGWTTWQYLADPASRDPSVNG